MQIDGSTQFIAHGLRHTGAVALDTLAMAQAQKHRPTVLAWQGGPPAAGAKPEIFLGSDFLDFITPPAAAGQSLSSLKSTVGQAQPQVCVYSAAQAHALLAVDVAALLREDPSAILLHGLLNVNSYGTNSFGRAESAIWTAVVLMTPLFRVAMPTRATALLASLDPEQREMCLQENLLAALSFTSPVIAEGLLSLPNGASPNQPSDDGMTPLEVAITQGRTDMVAALLAHGADKHQPTSSGETPLELVQDEAYLPMARYLA